jgi:hypothetical protein
VRPHPTSWVSADPLKYWALPEVPAVYVICVNGRAMYVGQTINLFRRFNAYRMRAAFGVGALTPWGQVEGDLSLKFSRSRRFGDWAMRELRLIRRLRPVWNCVGSTKERQFTGKYLGKKPSKTTNLAVAEATTRLVQ